MTTDKQKKMVCVPAYVWAPVPINRTLLKEPHITFYMTREDAQDLSPTGEAVRYKLTDFATGDSVPLALQFDDSCPHVKVIGQ